MKWLKQQNKTQQKKKKILLMLIVLQIILFGKYLSFPYSVKAEKYFNQIQHLCRLHLIAV